VLLANDKTEQALCHLKPPKIKLIAIAKNVTFFRLYVYGL